jgi:hypothetical protein
MIGPFNVSKPYFLRAGADMSRRRVGLESIDFQSGEFHRELTARIEEIMTSMKEKGAKLNKDRVQDLADVVEKYTNLSVLFDADKGFGPAVVPPDLIKNHALRREMDRAIMGGTDSIKQLRSNGGIVKGRVSLKDSTVDGWYKELVTTIYLPFDFFVGGPKFTPGEASAIILHEVGHIFVYLECLSRTITTNVVLSHLSKKWAGYTPGEREVVLKTAKDALDLPDGSVDTKTLATNTDPLVVETIYATQAAKQIVSEIGSGAYDNVSFEALADDFAARHGAGRDIVTALDKMYRSQMNIAYRGIAGYLFWEVAKIAMLTIFPAISLIVMINDHESSSSSYDKPNDRFRRIKNQLIERLKDRSQPPAIKEQLLQDIALINDILDKLNDRRQLFTLLLEKVFIFTDNRKRRDSLVLQRELEELAFNSLYVKSTELETLLKG